MTIAPQKLVFECTSDEFRVAVQGCGVKVEISSDGKVTVYSKAQPVAPQSAPETKATSVPKIGAMVLNGSIYAGMSPDTGKPMYTTPKDASMHCNFNQAADYAAKLEVYGCQDWRVPTTDELNVLFENRAAIGGFDTTGSNPTGWYWSSSRTGNYARVQRFSDGSQDCFFRHRHQSALRCVQG
jgi:hypothetical protein